VPSVRFFFVRTKISRGQTSNGKSRPRPQSRARARRNARLKHGIGSITESVHSRFRRVTCGLTLTQVVHGVSDARTDLDDRHSNTLDTLKTKPIFAMRSQANAYGAGDADDSSKQAQMVAKFNQRYQHYLDKSVPHLKERWGVWCGVAFIYLVRISFLKGWYIVTYGLGIYNLNLIIGFLSPQVDPETNGPTLPTKGNEEFKPFVRRLPEFKFWHRSAKSFVCTCLRVISRIQSASLSTAPL
jgi:hypothetical protein